MEVVIENRSAGKLFPTDQVNRAAYLSAAGHKVYKYQLSPTGRLQWVFPEVDLETGTSVHDTIREYNNGTLKVDARMLMTTWMEFRDLTRNKEFALGKTETNINGAGSK